MALAKDLSGLPKAKALKAEPVPPDSEALLLTPWITRQVLNHDIEGERPHAVEGTAFRHSMAGACARALGYEAAGVPKSDPFDIASILSTAEGTRRHDDIQAVLQRELGLEPEVAVELPEVRSSGSADGRVQLADLACWEHKNVGGYAYKLAVGCRPASSVAQGPQRRHIIQGALNAKGMGAEQLIVTYLTWEPISKRMAMDQGFDHHLRFTAQWTFPRSQWEPIADREIKRMGRILDCVQGGELPARVIPDPEMPPGHRIEDPTTGAYAVYDEDENVVDGGTYWGCDYCTWQTVCATTTSGRVPISEVLS